MVIGWTRESSCLISLQHNPGRSERKTIQGEMVEMTFQVCEALATKLQCQSVGASLGVTFESAALLKKQRRNPRPRWYDCLTGVSRVCVKILIACGPDWVVYHSWSLQWHLHQRE